MIDARWIIVDVVSLGDAALIAIGLGAGAFVARARSRARLRATRVLHSLSSPARVAGGLLALLVVAMDAFDLRADLHRALARSARDADLRS